MYPTAKKAGKATEASTGDENAFSAFYRGLSTVEGTIRLFERQDGDRTFYAVYGADALLIAREVFRTQSVIRWIGPRQSHDEPGLATCTMNRGNATNFLRDALTIRQMRVEIWTTDGAKKFRLERRASPGNLQAVEDLLFSDDNLYSAPVAMAVRFVVKDGSKTVGVAFADTSAREIGISEFVDNKTFSNLETLLIQLGVKEVILPESKTEDDHETEKLKTLLVRCSVVVSSQRKADFNGKNVEMDLQRLLKGDQPTGTIVELENVNAAAALAGLLAYLSLTTDDANHAAFTLRKHDLKQHMRLDATAVRALHLMPEKSTGGGAKSDASVFGLLNKCKTAQGVRMLAQWLKQPLVNLHAIRDRQDLVEAFFDDTAAREALRDVLNKMPDFARLCKKFKRKQASLQDVVRIYQAVLRLPDLISGLEAVTVSSEKEERMDGLLKRYWLDSLQEINGGMAKFIGLVEETIDLEELDRHNYIIRPEYDAEGLGVISEALEAVKEAIQEENERVAEDLGCEMDEKVLHFEDDKLYGKCYRLTRKESTKIRNKSAYRELKTQKDGVYFSTKAMRKLSEEHKDLSTKYEKQQASLVKQVIEIASTYVDLTESLNSETASLDVVLSLAQVAACSAIPYVRPTVHEKGTGNLTLRDARHPCLEVQPEMQFIPNDAEMTREGHLLSIITGPNMGGKSTYIRSIGCIALMAQMGSFVPCSEAELVRDSQLRGLSTFMAEMTETSAILRSATSDSLVIIDELGRGTSTYDGFGLAWAIAEHIATDIQAFCLFASHFHELQQLADQAPTVQNLHVQAHVEENPNTVTGKDVVLLYKVAKGSCDQSFGIQVAELANFPTEVVRLAKRKADIFEDSGDVGQDIPAETKAQGVDMVVRIASQWASSVKKARKDGVDNENAPIDPQAEFDLLKSSFEDHRAELTKNAWVRSILA